MMNKTDTKTERVKLISLLQLSQNKHIILIPCAISS